MASSPNTYQTIIYINTREGWKPQTTQQLCNNFWSGSLHGQTERDELIHCDLVTFGPFYLHDLTLIPAWISNYMPGRVWGEITYPFLNFNGATVEV